MDQIEYIDRLSETRHTERVYGEKALKLLYGDSLATRLIGLPLLKLLVKNPIFSAWYGYWQKQPSSVSKILPFIKKFQIDTSEFLDSIESFRSFNDFFTRRLKPEARPIAVGKDVAIIPADGRYRFYPNIDTAEGFIIKGEKFDLGALLESKELAQRYAQGTMVIARLCPTDYHRYHFPCDCVPESTRFINGWLYSVNPIALKKDIHIFTQNKRTICRLKSEHFGDVLFLEIGATNVGTIQQTYEPDQPYAKGAEKGFFSFGASSLILLFEPGRITLDADLLAIGNSELEIKCLMGQSMGKGKAWTETQGEIPSL